ncbi:MAG TPA: hypothetical protein VGI39_19180 [Polyangiaceae bacterium]|jgi:hypothetical protein
MSAETATPAFVRAAGFADSSGFMPIGGDVPGEVGAIDRALLLVAQQAAALDRATREGMWRTWKLEALADAEDEARAAFTRALASLPSDRADWRTLVEARRAGLEAFLMRYPPRRP